jgi:hypothetical protein
MDSKHYIHQLSWCPFQQGALGVSFKDNPAIKVVYLGDMPSKEPNPSSDLFTEMTLAVNTAIAVTETLNDIPFPYRTKQVIFQDPSAEVFTWVPTPMGSEIMKIMTIHSKDNVPDMMTLYHPPRMSMDPAGRMAMIKKSKLTIMEPTAPFVKDISDLMHQRAQQGYSLEPEKNMRLNLEDGLKRIWQRLASSFILFLMVR